jgi:hypothetical protein
MVETRQLLTFLFPELIQICYLYLERINVWDEGKEVSKRHLREIYNPTKINSYSRYRSYFSATHLT